MALRKPLNPSVTKLRSGVSNDPYRLPNVDMSSAYGRRFRDLVQDLAREFGGVEKLNTIELVLIRQAAADTIRAERMQVDLARGGTVSHEELTRVCNSARSALTKLRERPRRPRDTSTAPTLAAYLDDNPEAAT